MIRAALAAGVVVLAAVIYAQSKHAEADRLAAELVKERGLYSTCRARLSVVLEQEGKRREIDALSDDDFRARASRWLHAGPK